MATEAPAGSTPSPRLLRWCHWLRLPVLALAGCMLSCAFAPLEQWWCAPIALAIVCAYPAHPRWHHRLLGGLVFGYCHFATTLHWLNTVGFGAGWLLALYCAIYPALWYLLSGTLLWQQKRRRLRLASEATGRPNNQDIPGAAIWQPATNGWVTVLTAVQIAGLWTGLEWVRSWLFTGFPWNQLGIAYVCQAQLRQNADLAGVYGLTFLTLLTALALAQVAGMALFTPKRILRAGVLWLTVPALLLALIRGEYSRRYWQEEFSLDATTHRPALRLLAIQGDVPMCRYWSEAEYLQAWNGYANLTRQALKNTPSQPPIHAVIWPEGAVPAPIVWQQYSSDLQRLLREMPCPLLMGAIDHRPVPNQPEDVPPPAFNSVFLLRRNSPVLRSAWAPRQDYYDKTHLVPFGEYVPLGKYFPWLVDFIGMGRDLTPGKNFTLFRLNNATAGVNICFEDLFPEISRRFALDGANLLLTLTNDCWYEKSSGAAQHRNHAVFRALENRLPLMRSGNNSDTMLIAPDGRQLHTIKAFQAGYQLYEIPINPAPEKTHYARYGNYWAWICFAMGIVTLLQMLVEARYREIAATKRHFKTPSP